MKVAFLTLGCKVNSYETEKMKLQMEQAGHLVVSFQEAADVYIINTCTVTNIADRKSRKMLHRARRMNENAIVVAAGCYVDSARQRGEVDDSVDIFLSNADKDTMVEVIEEAVRKKGLQVSQETSSAGEHISGAARAEEHTRAYIKVQNGCNQYCTYCIIPYVRGPLTSRAPQEVVAEAERLAGQGVQEVVLTGIHLSSYGVDWRNEKIDANTFLQQQGEPLLQLIRQISRVDGIERIRLGSLEPRIITEEFAGKLAEIPEVCPHFHLSLQSGCDATLRRMNRHYTTEEYLEKLRILRKYFEHPAVTTDIIVGFPQETQEEFETTCAFARKAGFAQIHVFKYSRRKGTIADAMDGQMEENCKAQRSDTLLAVEQELESEYLSYFMDRVEEVLLEEVTQIDGKDYLIGYNERYVRIAVPVTGVADDRTRCNTIASVRILGHLTDEILLGAWK